MPSLCGSKIKKPKKLKKPNKTQKNLVLFQPCHQKCGVKKFFIRFPTPSPKIVRELDSQLPWL